ncbi:MAG: RCC1 domain-containing protein [Ketobacteraceae bacterium]|nr:RCC1 domain-containing protein [Ketobacteraceae bacterium]
MKNTFHFYLLLVASCLLQACGGHEQTNDLSAGWDRICASHGESISCWGYDKDNPEQSYFFKQEFSEPVVAVGSSHHCVLTNREVSCWGDNNSSQTDVPHLSNPYALAAGHESSCALDDTGVVCWGDEIAGQSEALQLSSPRYLVAGLNHVCAASETRIKCTQKRGIARDYPVPKISGAIRALVASPESSRICLQDGNGWQCWSDQTTPNIPYGVPGNIRDALDLDISMKETCAIVDQEIKCWNSEAVSDEAPEVETLDVFFLNPSRLALSPHEVCVTDDLGLVCVGRTAFGGRNVNVPGYLLPE